MNKYLFKDFPSGPVVKNLPANAGNMGSISGLGRSHRPLELLNSCVTATEPESIYKGLEKGEFNTMKHSFYKRLFLSHEGLMSPLRDVELL